MCSACVDVNELVENYKQQEQKLELEQKLEAWIEQSTDGPRSPTFASRGAAGELLDTTRLELGELQAEAARMEATRATAPCTGYGFVVLAFN